MIEDLMITDVYGWTRDDGEWDRGSGFTVQWVGAMNGRFPGMGMVTVTLKKDGSLVIDNEYMSDEFNKALFEALLKQAVRR